MVDGLLQVVGARPAPTIDWFLEDVKLKSYTHKVG